MPTLAIGNTCIDYVLKRSDSATRARITVTPKSVEVLVPAAATAEEIAGVLARRRAWLFEQTRRMAAQEAQANRVYRFVTGAKVPYRGRLMRLWVEGADDVEQVDVAYRNGFVIRYPRATLPSSKDDLIESALRLWLRKRLRADVAEFVGRHGERQGLKPKGFVVKEQKHLWGSCGRDGVVNLNWHLIFAPKTVLEYAVVHELCHLRHRSHDIAFWNLVGSILPDWQARKAWLDQNERFLSLDRLDGLDGV